MRPSGLCTNGTFVTGHDSDSKVYPSSSFSATIALRLVPVVSAATGGLERGVRAAELAPTE
eukprot:scaffold137090_cov30-Tisochrysis_lutea.AAC.1